MDCSCSQIEFTAAQLEIADFSEGMHVPSACSWQFPIEGLECSALLLKPLKGQEQQLFLSCSSTNLSQMEIRLLENSL